MNAKRLLMTIAAGAMTLMIGVSPALAQGTGPAATDKPAAQPSADAPKKADKKEGKKDAKKDTKEAEEVAVGAQAPDFKLKDINGKEYNLSELTKSGKIVVLQWFNPECPFVQKHYNTPDKTFNNLNAKYKDKGVVLLAINSSPAGSTGSGAERNTAAAKKWDIKYPILLDETQAVGRSYGAKNTPVMFVIGKDGKVAYTGAIDDDRNADKPGKTNYVAKALDEMLAGTSVTKSKTEPYGCHIAYKDN